MTPSFGGLEQGSLKDFARFSTSYRSTTSEELI